MVIVAAVDRSERAELVVGEAEALAEAFSDTVHVVYSLTRSEFVDLGRTSMEESGEMIDMEQIREVATDIAAEPAATLNVPAEAVGLVGEPAERVVEYADEQDARYIVVGPRKRSPTGKAVFGSVAQSVLLNAGCPVVTTIAEP